MRTKEKALSLIDLCEGRKNGEGESLSGSEVSGREIRKFDYLGSPSHAPLSPPKI